MLFTCFFGFAITAATACPPLEGINNNNNNIYYTILNIVKYAYFDVARSRSAFSPPLQRPIRRRLPPGNELFFYTHVLSHRLSADTILFYGTISSSVVNCCFFSKWTIWYSIIWDAMLYNVRTLVIMVIYYFDNKTMIIILLILWCMSILGQGVSVCIIHTTTYIV